MTRTLGLQEVLQASHEYQMSTMLTMMPAIVVSVDNAQQRVDVQPAINMLSPDGEESTPRPTILNVPLLLPTSDRGGLTMPISVGCPVELRWSMRGLEKWKRGDGKPDSPSDARRFNIGDCFAQAGVYPWGMSKNSPQSRTNAHSPEDVVLVHNMGTGSEVEIRLKTNGDVVVNSPTRVVVNCVDAEVNADSSVVTNTQDFTVNTNTFQVNSSSYLVSTGTYGVSATGQATTTGNMNFVGNIEHQGDTSQTGSFSLNGTTVEDHSHSGVVSGGSRTQPFGE